MKVMERLGIKHGIDCEHVDIPTADMVAKVNNYVFQGQLMCLVLAFSFCVA